MVIATELQTLLCLYHLQRKSNVEGLNITYNSALQDDDVMV